MDLGYALIICLLGLIIIVLIISQRRERRELCDRIQSGSLREFKGEPAHQAVSAHKRVLKRWRGGDIE